MTRDRAEIMRDLNTLMAELNAAMQNERAQTERLPDISPKLAQALDQTDDDYTSPPRRMRHTRATMPSTADVPLESHEDIRAKARAYKPSDYSGTMADYKPTDDPDHDNS